VCSMCPRNAEFRQGVAHRQRRPLDQLDDLQLLGGGVSHASSSPAPIAVFFSNWFSSVSSATTSLSALASRRSSLTSSEVAARAVSPARRRALSREGPRVRIPFVRSASGSVSPHKFRGCGVNEREVVVALSREPDRGWRDQRVSWDPHALRQLSVKRR
jgi:hypothetical protein